MITSAAPSTYSDEYVGSSPATHSPQPSVDDAVALDLGPHEQDAPAGLRAEAGLERGDEREADLPQLARSGRSRCTSGGDEVVAVAGEADDGAPAASGPPSSRADAVAPRVGLGGVGAPQHDDVVGRRHGDRPGRVGLAATSVGPPSPTAHATSRRSLSSPALMASSIGP